MELITFSGWHAIIHFDKDHNPVWFSYMIMELDSSLSHQMSSDLSKYFSQSLRAYDIFGIDGYGSGKIRIV